jgi:D-aminopeptidase
VHVINGFGKTVGLPQVTELGQIESPILLTSTLSVWRVADAHRQGWIAFSAISAFGSSHHD